MGQRRNYQEFYRRVDDTCLRLGQVGFDEEARLISYMLHHVPWTTASELLRDLESELRGLLSGTKASLLPQDLKDEIEGHIRLLENT